MIADPFNELPMKTAKYASNTEELYLGGKKINQLGEHFRFFSNLECLWLNDNLLEDINGLEENFRLKTIYLHNNRFSELNVDEIEHMIALNTLMLGNNMIHDLLHTLSALKALKSLRTLELAGNPISKEDNYRLRVIGELPFIVTLDRRKITKDERVEAAAYLKKLSKLKNFKLQMNDTRKKPPPTAEEIADKKTHREVKEYLTNILKKTNIAIDQSFVSIDKRKIGYIEEEKFWQIMRQYGLATKLNDNEKRVVSSKYTKKVNVVHISQTGVLPKVLIDYRAFCFDVCPNGLCSLVPTKYKMDPCPEISASTVDLERYVKTIKQRREEEATLLKKQTLLASASHDFSSSEYFSTSAKGDLLRNGLDPFSNMELRKLLKQYGSSGTMNKKQIQSVFDEMMAFSRELDNAEPDAFFKALKLENESDTIQTANVLDILTSGQKIKWRTIHENDAENLQSSLFKSSTKNFDLLMMAGAKDNTASLKKDIFHTSIGGTRLGKTRKSKPTVTETVSYPSLLKSASKRSDILILPNLNTYDKGKNTLSQSLDISTLIESSQGALGNKIPETLKETTDCRTPFYIPEIPPDQLYSKAVEMAAKAKSSGVVPYPTQTYNKGWNESTGSMVFER